jgi:hypothetical protein
MEGTGIGKKFKGKRQKEKGKFAFCLLPSAF